MRETSEDKVSTIMKSGAEAAYLGEGLGGKGGGGASGCYKT